MLNNRIIKFGGFSKIFPTDPLDMSYFFLPLRPNYSNLSKIKLLHNLSLLNSGYFQLLLFIFVCWCQLWPIPFCHRPIIVMFNATQHQNQINIVIIDCLPKTSEITIRSLAKNRIFRTIDKRSNLICINMIIIDLFDHYPAMFIYITINSYMRLYYNTYYSLVFPYLDIFH